MRRALFVLLMLCTSIGFARAALVPPGTPVAGRTQAALADAWWQWILTTPASVNPLTDTTGALAQVNNAGPVFFLAGSAGSGLTSRSITVPAGTPLFFPLANSVDFEVPVALDPGSCLGKPDPYACAIAFITPFAAVTDLNATLNGVALDPNLASDAATYFHQSSALNPLCFPADPMFASSGAVPGCGAVYVQNGYYMALNGLAPGTYTLQFGGAFTAAPGLGRFGAVDTITVVPEPVSALLLGAGLTVLGCLRRRRAGGA